MALASAVSALIWSAGSISSGEGGEVGEGLGGFDGQVAEVLEALAHFFEALQRPHGHHDDEDNRRQSQHPADQGRDPCHRVYPGRCRPRFGLPRTPKHSRQQRSDDTDNGNDNGFHSPASLICV